MKSSDYTFETLVTTPSNCLAQLAAKKICETPNLFNPLYIYGPPGVGKPIYYKLLQMNTRARV